MVPPRSAASCPTAARCTGRSARWCATSLWSIRWRERPAPAPFVDPAAITEDPSTGSAAGPLLAFLRERAGTTALTVEHGVEMGRPSRIECAWEKDRPRVSGDVVADGDVRR
jgi:hypothetical protein